MKRPSLVRRLLAILYDTFLMLTIWIIGTALWLCFNQGQAIASHHHFLFQIYLVLLWFSFTLWFWIKGGQTTGMAAWRIRLVTLSNQPLSFKQALIRQLLAIPSFLLGGFGFWWAIWDKDKLTLYDRLSKTQLILI